MPEEMKRAQAAAAAATAVNGTAGQGGKSIGAAPPQLVKVPVAQSLSPARTASTPAQKSPLVMATSAPTLSNGVSACLRSEVSCGTPSRYLPSAGNTL